MGTTKNGEEIKDCGLTTPNISGVSGWLGYLVVMLTILNPLLGAVKISTQFRLVAAQFPQLANNPQWKDYMQVSWVIVTAAAAICFVAGYRLWKIHFFESVRFTITALWLAGPLGNILNIISAVIIFGSNAGSGFFTQMVAGTISSAIGAGIWTTYLMRSARVRNTYKLQHPGR